MELDPYSSPLAYFGDQLKRLRERAGMTLAEVADRTHFSISTISAYERGKLIPSVDYARMADEMFGTGDHDGNEGELERFQKLVENVSVRPWFRDRIDVEKKTKEICEYDPYGIPGLLETEDYAHAAISAGRPKLTEDEITRALAIRLTRQQILEPNHDLPIDRENHPRFWGIIDEAALRREVGGSDVMDAQYRHLIDMAQRPNITLQVMPDSAGITCAYGHAFTILRPKSGKTTVYVEGVFDAQYLHDPDTVDLYTLVFDHLRTTALNDVQSLQLLKGLI
jgi:transcriptional regulator with XRE-family HTH domain